MAYELLSQRCAQPLSATEVLAVLLETPDMKGRRDWGEVSQQWFSGAFIHGGCAGVRNSARAFPWVTALVCRYVKQSSPDHRFGAIYFSLNLLAEPRKDSNNSRESQNLVLALSESEHGGLWIEDPAGDVVRKVNEKNVSGCVHAFEGGAIKFDPRLLHATERWSGDRAVLVAYMPRDLDKLSSDDQACPRELGFQLDRPLWPKVVNFSTEFGIRWTPAEFVVQASRVKHPSHLRQLLPCELVSAIQANFSKGEFVLGQERTAAVRRWMAEANSLAASEAELKGQFSANRRAVLCGKRLLLFKQLLAEAGHDDQDLFDNMCVGFDLVGKLPESGVFKRKFRPAAMLVDNLRSGAKRARDALLSTVGPSDDPEIDKGVLLATRKELEAGYAEGPVDIAEIPEDAAVTRRFGVRQGETEDGPKTTTANPMSMQLCHKRNRSRSIV